MKIRTDVPGVDSQKCYCCARACFSLQKTIIVTRDNHCNNYSNKNQCRMEDCNKLLSRYQIITVDFLNWNKRVSYISCFCNTVSNEQFLFNFHVRFMKIIYVLLSNTHSVIKYKIIVDAFILCCTLGLTILPVLPKMQRMHQASNWQNEIGDAYSTNRESERVYTPELCQTICRIMSTYLRKCTLCVRTQCREFSYRERRMTVQTWRRKWTITLAHKLLQLYLQL